VNFAATIDFEQTRQAHENTVYVTITSLSSLASGSLIGYNILQQRKRIEMFIIARKHITPRRMLYRARIVLESCSNRNCNRPIKITSRIVSYRLRATKGTGARNSLLWAQTHTADSMQAAAQVPCTQARLRLQFRARSLITNYTTHNTVIVL